MNTITVTASDFRANQKKYFDMAENTPVLVTRVGKRPVKISVVEESFTKEELQAIKEGFEDIKNGRFVEKKEDESWEEFFKRSIWYVEVWG